MKIGAVGHLRVSSVFTQIFGCTLGAGIGDPALSLGERVASGASRVRGHLVWLDPVPSPCRATDPSPGPRRLVKAPVAVHPLPAGEGKDPTPSLSPGGGVRKKPLSVGRTTFTNVFQHPAKAPFFLPSAYCFLPTAYFTRPIPPAKEPW
jgi:hypothetical protein